MIIIFILLGTILASFYTNLAMRLSNGESIITPRSHCPNCNHKLAWYDLFPILSYIFLGGKCHYCHKKIDRIYILIEILGGILFGLSYYLYGFSYELIAALIISSLIMIIFVSDFKYLIIIDGVVYVGAILIVILKLIFFGTSASIYSLLSAIIMFIFMYTIKLIGDYTFKKESLGGGDIKLALFIGATLGVKLSLVVIVLASFIAIPYAFYYIIKNQAKEVPFGPFLILSTLIVFIYMEPIREYLINLFIL